jgi:cytochrome c peroxidase
MRQTSGKQAPARRRLEPGIEKATCAVALSGLLVVIAGPVGAGGQEGSMPEPERLRAIYSQPPAHWPEPEVDAGVDFRELAPLPPPPERADNLLTPAKIALGKKLFFDPRLSRNGEISCASCHDPARGWTDGRDQSIGHAGREGSRNAMALFNVGHFRRLFWDGRAPGLEAQALKPVTNPVEMNSTRRALEETLNGIPGYRRQVQAVFGADRVRAEHAAKALAAFQRTLVSRPSAVDRFLQGERGALDGQELRGLHLFRTRARCMNCHHGPLLTDREFHNLGLTYYGRRYEDLGRYRVTKDPEDVGRFMTPSLRNVMRTGPWMHNGLFPDMMGILRMYNHGGADPEPEGSERSDPLFPEPSPLLQPLNLNERELAALKAFLEALSSPSAGVDRPELPPG